MGLSMFRADQIRQENKGISEAQAWLNHGLVPRRVNEVPAALQKKPSEKALDLRQISSADIGQLLGWAERGIDANSAALSLGATREQMDLLQIAVAEYASKIGRDFHSRGEDRDGAGTVSRRMSAAHHLYRLWDISSRGDDDGEAKALMSVVTSLFAHAKSTDKDALILPAREVGLLQRMLVGCGHDEHQIQINAHAMPTLRVMRVKRSASGNRYAGLELKRILGVIWIRRRLHEIARSE